MWRIQVLSLSHNTLNPADVITWSIIFFQEYYSAIDRMISTNFQILLPTCLLRLYVYSIYINMYVCEYTPIYTYIIHYTRTEEALCISNSMVSPSPAFYIYNIYVCERGRGRGKCILFHYPYRYIIK